MKRLIVILVLVASISTQALPLSVDNYIVPTAPISYSDGRPSPSWRLPVTDNGISLRYGNALDGSDIKGARDAFIYQEAGKYYMTYDGIGTSNWGVNEAVSTDLTNWTNMGRVLNHGTSGTADSASAAYGTIYKDGSTYWMWYLGAKVKSAQPTNIPLPPYITMLAQGPSPTGPWTKKPNKPIDLVDGSYHEITASPGPIIKRNGQYYMYFSTAAEHLGKYYRGIGLAWTPNLNNAKWSIGSGPVIPIYEQTENASLYYQQEDNTWYMFVDHLGINSAGEETTDAVWMYWSHDPLNWNTDNKAVVVDGSMSWSSTVIGLPTVVQHDGKLVVIYDGRETLDNNLTNNIYHDLGKATIDIPIKAPE